MLKIISRQSLHPNFLQCCHSSVRLIHRGSRQDDDADLLPKKSRIVICGSGLAGSSLAYHLSLLDHGHHTVVLERGTISENKQVKDSGSSGLVGNFKNSCAQVTLAQYSLNLLDNLTNQGFDIGWSQCGSLNVARTSDRMTQYRKMKSQSLTWGIECNLLSPEECQAMCPLIEASDLKGGLFIPKDGVVDKEKLRQVLLKEAIKNGVTLVENCQVEKVLQSDHRVNAVQTNLGTVECVYFVNAAGFWARAIGQLSEPYVKGDNTLSRDIQDID
jgi:pyruvate dehydrogenase phosphatase regulatory subunit